VRSIPSRPSTTNQQDANEHQHRPGGGRLTEVDASSCTVARAGNIRGRQADVDDDPEQEVSVSYLCHSKQPEQHARADANEYRQEA
jgi:hypothetical protein